MTTNYTYEELERIAEALRSVWQDSYRGGWLPGMRSRIGDTGTKAFEGLSGDVIEVVGGSILSGMPLKAVIAMQDFAHEEALRIENGYAPVAAVGYQRCELLGLLQLPVDHLP